MFIINELTLKFAWESDEFIEKMELETSYVANMVSNDDKFLAKAVFTGDELPFFEQNINAIMTDVVDIFQKFIELDSKSFFVDILNNNEEWKTISKLSGFSVINKRNTDQKYNDIRLKIIDERVRDFILKSLMVQWYKTLGDLMRFKQSSDDKANAYISMYCALRYLKIYGAYKSNSLTSKTV